MSWNIKTPGDYINGPLTVVGDVTVGSNAFRVDTVNKRIGVNIANPAAPAHIYASGSDTASVRMQAAGGRTFDIGSTASGYGAANNFIIYDVTAGAERLRIDSAGNALLPTGYLQLQGNQAGWPTKMILGNSDTGGYGVDIAWTLNDYSNNAFYSPITLRSTFSGGVVGGSVIFRGKRLSTSSIIDVLTIYGGGDVAVNSGNLVMGTAGKGIDFSAGLNAVGATSEILNDYEEGTWTPSLTFATPGTLAINYSLRNGNYTKVGNLVTARFAITINPSQFSKGTASGTLIFGGLPFNIGSSGTYYFDLAASLADQNTGTLILSNLVGGTNQIYCESVSTSGTRIARDYAGITAANFASTNAGFITIAAVVQYTV